MMLIRGDYKTPNEDLFNKIQQVYSEYFKPETEYKPAHSNTPMHPITDMKMVCFPSPG